MLIAMNLGVPVIASRIEGLNEVFEDGVSGMFVTNDPHEIAGAMRRVVEHPELAHRLIVVVVTPCCTLISFAVSRPLARRRL